MTRVRAPDDTAIVEAMSAIRDEFERYGWRRMQAHLRQQGLVVNHKKVKRLMREHDLQPRMRRRYVAPTSSDHDHPIFCNLAKDMVVNGANQLWVADITYVAVAMGFVYVAVILDAWSRRVTPQSPSALAARRPASVHRQVRSATPTTMRCARVSSPPSNAS